MTRFETPGTGKNRSGMRQIKMVDLHSQYLRIKGEIDGAIQNVLTTTDFIQGHAVRAFEQSLSRYLGDVHVVSCGNGTDALQIAMMALDFKAGDEIIVPAHTYVATAEAIALLKLVPVFVDVDPATFNIDVSQVETLITKKTVAIVPVHLYGQSADMKTLGALATKHNLHILEDAAQSLGADLIFPDGRRQKVGTVGSVGTTSFFPSKNLGAYGDGGAIFSNDKLLAERLRMIANHGQKKKYHHDVVGINSRLDTLQAAVLNVKLSSLDQYIKRRSEVAAFYDTHLLKPVSVPARAPYSTHVFHQYTITIPAQRDALKAHLESRGIPSMIYYPVPLHLQPAYRRSGFGKGSFPVTENLSETVLSLPIHTEMDTEQLAYICESVNQFAATI
jgi:UDP-2-acetamido-2-deoxy-ribo-hexuluronate aminotransferase